ncbi:NUDIX hydrolase [Mycolicibacterium smegmatis]|uniref:NUDIX hydrolase n=2 Tax=Mycolicibacterium smegmatis (strain ATCC 700084 / mc(2)155) TaxID=246196 RepID=I7FFR7_MYCS2|nr:NUDIX domain-containing protein [Mycolicibacterium smegmatis]ABK74970.1 nudix hydrolase [Mycolicibacterium smegmatis MC2 155]AFP37708.1 NUDIX hydrolase [Mycolicibacterium smegmatis MC2 155]AIU06510.1 NUDIX hydrolase [Mycolicibacterium smegmatis MC2 155]AIU13135.1 NUDIX hydrolase [Mycolicibacterium smegmatis]AIU19759.1 NUDIX hydrolase [Mycolicibacterium smegmatis]
MDNAEYQDSSGRTLGDYPRPSVAVDAAVLTVGPDAGLSVLQVRRAQGRGWALPGTFLHPGETLADAVNRALATKANVHGLRPRQLHVFDDPKRDDRGWVLSVAHVAVVPLDFVASRFPESTRLVPAHAPGRLVYDHADIIALAVGDVRTRYETAPDPDHLLGDEFTLRDLRLIHEAVTGHALQRDTFRRSMESQLVATGATVSRGRGRPAELFRRRDTAGRR